MTTILQVNNSTVFEMTVTNPNAVPIYVNDAAVTVTVLDSAGATVLAATALSYVSASNGIYRLTVITPLSITAGHRYTVIYDVLGSDSLVGQSQCSIVAIPPSC